jgi:hypothetical protein
MQQYISSFGRQNCVIHTPYSSLFQRCTKLSYIKKNFKYRSHAAVVPIFSETREIHSVIKYTDIYYKIMSLLWHL